MPERLEASHEKLCHKGARLLHLVGTVFTGVVYDIAAACHIVQKRNEKPGVQQHRGDRRFQNDEHGLFPESPPPQKQRGKNDKKRRNFRGNHVGEKNTRAPRRHGNPTVPVPPCVLRHRVKQPQAVQDKRHKGHRRILAHRRPRVNASETVYIQGIQHSTCQTDFRSAHFTERVVGNSHRQHVDHHHITFVGRLHRHAEIPKQRRNIQKEIPVKYGDRVSVAIQPPRLNPHRKHAVFQPCPDSFNAHQMKIQIMGI